ncbi:phage-related protein [Shouchella clausii KSM-K16]|uniref:Phage-related protein n=1 Tax=Shouchella clausii (strain KSM-K16) TaxID=66692 RepID=Q5WE53_SHOC1|nr:phage tail family protein [Shouchella clausii]BAD65357.1 phage-related protein [Shouchella clausii KSM-K16]
MILTVERLNGEKYVLNEELGLICSDFFYDSPSPITETSTRPGVDGFNDLGTTYDGRTLYARFYLVGANNYHYAMLRHQVFKLFDSREEFYIYSDEESRKRWRVKCASSYAINRIAGPLGEFEVPFISKSPYAESLGTLQQDFTFAEDVWAFAQNIPLKTPLKYEYTIRRFSIWNLGDTTIDGRHHDLKIFYTGASKNLTITNHTTGDVWRYDGTTNAGDTIVLDGVFARKNGDTIFGQTNRKVMTLAVGENEFQLAGTSGKFKIQFDFRFLYL